jgi:hypothetical protein
MLIVPCCAVLWPTCDRVQLHVPHPAHPVTQQRLGHGQRAPQPLPEVALGAWLALPQLEARRYKAWRSEFEVGQGLGWGEGSGSQAYLALWHAGGRPMCPCHGIPAQTVNLCCQLCRVLCQHAAQGLLHSQDVVGPRS